VRLELPDGQAATDAMADALLRLVHDPQTSGGLLIVASAAAADLVEHALREREPQARRVGLVRSRTPELDVLIRR
jgi:selenophosphate synthase